jgi:uncharacterized protein
LERERLIEMLRMAGCSEDVVSHCIAVERLALRIAGKIARNGHRVDERLVGMGALVHDIGRSETHGIDHGVRGAEILRRMGMESLSVFAERHIGAGIPAEEAKGLGLPERDYLPRTIEEKIVAYADKLVEGKKAVPYRNVLARFRREFGPDHPAVRRLELLHREMEEMMSGGRSPQP